MTVHRWQLGGLFLLSAAVVWVAADVEPVEDTGEMLRRVGERHVLYTDASEARAEETLERLDALLEHCRRWLAEDSVRPDRKLPVYLYRRYDPYAVSLDRHLLDSAAAYNGRELRICADASRFAWADIWDTVRHEAFHQIAHRLIDPEGHWPLWLHEGLAEYYAETPLVGDPLESQPISGEEDAAEAEALQARLELVKKRIRMNQFRAWEEVLTIRAGQWDEPMMVVNYDQVWAMVHFLLHGEDARYADSLEAYARDPDAAGKPLETFRRHFGQNIRDLQLRHDQWWLGLSADELRRERETPGGGEDASPASDDAD